MIGYANDLLLESALEGEDIVAETEELRAKLDSLRSDPTTTEEDIRVYELAIELNLRMIRNIEQSAERFAEEVEALKN